MTDNAKDAKDADIERTLTLLRNKIRERGFTQLEVQAKLGWGRSYLSQLFTQQKTLRIEQVMMILEAIDVSPQEFYSELYHFPSYSPFGYDEGTEAAMRSLREIKALVQGVVQILVDKGVVTDDEILDATEKLDDEDLEA